MPDIRTVTGVPYEASRAAVDPSVIQEWLNMLEAEIPEIPRAFVFNMDETGCSDWADRPREVTLIVPTSCEDGSLPVPFDRNSKRASMAVCIAADDWPIRPFIVVHRATVERELIHYGHNQWRVLLDTQPCAFMTHPLFLEWANQKFFLALAIDDWNPLNSSKPNSAHSYHSSAPFPGVMSIALPSKVVRASVISIERRSAFS
jgi:hypothetical protein